MRLNLKHIWQRLLEFLRLSPLSLAEKCRLAFGAAVVFILALALLLPYIWMGKLTTKASLDAGRATAQTLLRRHFQTKQTSETALPALNNKGAVLDANDTEMRWIRFRSPAERRSAEVDEKQLQALTNKQKRDISLLKADESRNDSITFAKHDGVLQSNYVRIVRANDNCISCHNPQGSAGAFVRNEPVGVMVIQRPAREISKMTLFNLFWIIAAGLIGGTGAIIAFYMITQRVILRPIRQLRALANNIAEGNLDTRSAIKTGDEYEKFANAFNNMLDALQTAQEKLRQANKQLDAKIAELSGRNIELFKANKVKSEFLANISHEFKTPLNAILGFAQVLRDKPKVLKEDKGRRYAENIITSGNQLLNMINDLLDLAKTEAGKMKLHIEQTSVHQLLKTVVAQFSLLTKKKKIKVKLLVDDNIPTLSTDAGKVQQILYNFISNAVKFTPPRGRIIIQATSSPATRGTADEPRFVRISVTDTGCGIAAADKEKIFEKFRHADGSITRESTGTGLGLTISKELAAMLAGNIGLESEVGHGSTFWLDIPITLAKSENKTTEPADLVLRSEDTRSP